jgi:hypothetical protein
MALAGAAAKHMQILRSFRSARAVVRVARAAKVLQVSPELMILAHGMVAGMRGVVVVLVLLMLVIYIYAIVFTQTLAKTSIGSGVFDSVLQSMNCLMLQVLCGADSVFMNSLLEYNWMLYLIFLSYLLVSNLTLMNMLIAILCDVVSAASRQSFEEAFKKEVDSHIARMASELDQDGSGGISREEFENILSDHVTTSAFNDIGVDIVGVAHFAKFIYEQTDEISYADFAKLVGQFCGRRNATVKDVMDVSRYITVEILSLEHRNQQRFVQLEGNQKRVLAEIDARGG